MGRAENMFYKVITSENSVTELFCNLLAEKVFRDLFLGMFLSSESVESIRFDHIDTQFYLKDLGRPDLAIKNDNIEILFEIKIENAHLTGNQPEGYLEYLQSSSRSDKYLILIIPPNYKHLMEWETRFKNSQYSNQIKTYNICWTQIIERLAASNLPNQSDIFRNFLDLLKEWYVVHFSTQELLLMDNRQIPRLIEKFYDLIEMVCEHFKVRSHMDSGEYGIYFKTKEGKDGLFFGIWYDCWESIGSPICFGVCKDYPEEVVDRFRKNLPGIKIVEFKDWYLCNLDKDILTQENCVEEIVKVIEAQKVLLELK